jgi:putative transcriptional regulator
VRNRLRVFRAEYRLSQTDLAERLGVARQTVHAIETGKFAPSLTLAFKIASLFGANINDVFAPDPDETLPALEATPFA